MALETLFVLLLGGLAVSIPCVTSSCNVTCSTDYVRMVNCSCSGTTTYPITLKIHCSHDGDVVEGSCDVEQPRSWCVMNLPHLYQVTSVGVKCTSTASHPATHLRAREAESSSWDLSNVVKPQTPSNVLVTNTDGLYNISWANHNPDDCLEYRVRIRESHDLTKAPVPSSVLRSQYFRLHHSQLQPGVNYTVDVQAHMCPSYFLQGPWSEWSTAAVWRTPAAPSGEAGGLYGYCWFVLLPIILGCSILLCYFQRQFWPKRLQVVTYIPRANVFFEPLYHDHGGNFKEWVKPLFSECDYPRFDSHVQLMSEKQHAIPQWSEEKKSFREGNETSDGSRFLHMPLPQSSLFLHLQGDGSSQGTSHSAGHVSIHTVTLFGEEYEEDAVSQSSSSTLRSYQEDGDSFGSFEEVDREHAGYDSEGPQLDRQERENQMSIELSEVRDISFEPRAEFNEPERVSLDSFASNEQSEDGYPRVDLDTFDSGFAECSSPGALDTTEQMDSSLFQEQKYSSSNYVKQWMICNTIQEDSTDTELRETQ